MDFSFSDRRLPGLVVLYAALGIIALLAQLINTGGTLVRIEISLLIN
jgi:hypothetical protein